MNLLKDIKREILITTITIIGLTITFFGLTYAIYFTIDEKNIGEVSARLAFDMCVDDNCTGYGTTYGTTIVGEIYPMSDAEGIAQTPYRFKLTTDSIDDCMYAQIYAAINDDIDMDHVKYATRVGSSGSYTYGDFSTGPIVTLKNEFCWQAEDGDYILELYVWLDEAVGNDMIGQRISVLVNALGYYKPYDPNNLHTGDSVYANIDTNQLTQTFEYDSNQDYQTFTAPMNGYYYIEAYGPDDFQMRGDIVSGYIYLNKDEKLYLYIGGSDTSTSTSIRYFSQTPTASQLAPYTNLRPAASPEILIASYGDGDESILSGYPGTSFPDSSGQTTTNAPSTLHFSGKYFINPKIVYSETELDGAVVIKYVGPLKRVNTKLDNVRYIKDCTNGNNSNAYNQWVEIEAMKEGENIALNKTVTGTVSQYSSSYPYSKIVDGKVVSAEYGRSSSNGLQCVTVDLGATYNLDEIAVWHVFSDGRTFNNNVTSVSSNNSSWTEVINNQIPENYNTNKRVSAY